jgi:hypothetical protein
MRLIFSTNNCLSPKDKVDSSVFSGIQKQYFFSALDVEILYDSSIHFNDRLYIKLGVDITHIKLCRTLRDIISQPLIFVRDVLPKETFEALDKLHQVRFIRNFFK